MKQTTLSDSAPRFDIYADIHKALRAMMADTLVAAGRTDVHDAAQLHALRERVLTLCHACACHLRHENAFIHPAMQAQRPGSARQSTADHAEHLLAITELRRLVSVLSATDPAPGQAEQAARALYRALALFMAENIVHMHAEEVEHNPVLWACYSDAELLALQERVTASLAPADHLMFMRWMVPAIPPPERTALMAAVQATAPPPALAAVLDAVQPHLSARDWQQLTGALQARPPADLLCWPRPVDAAQGDPLCT